MKAQSKSRWSAVPHTNVSFRDAFWGPRIDTNREVSIPFEYKMCKETGRLDAFNLQPPTTTLPAMHRFADSDVAKWLEAACLSLATDPDRKLLSRVKSLVELIVRAQQPDGYLNTWFTAVEPAKRFTNLRQNHELYCAGHLIEAALAHYRATGHRTLLNAVTRYVDLIERTFGPGPDRKPGYDGHPEIELALVKLYRVTGEWRYLDLASFFIDERGKTPYYFDLEAVARGEAPSRNPVQEYRHSQSHVPVRQQKEAVGHVVRALYLYAGMTDVAVQTDDRPLLKAVDRLWKSVVGKRMYITGAVGSSRAGERFTFDCDLPNEVGYAETCANIALVMLAHRLLQARGDREYADVMERTLYNSVLSGVGLDGTSFFYSNPLTVFPPASVGLGKHLAPTRQNWFDCPCCPPNISRLLASLGQYVYSCGQGEIAVHLFVRGELRAELPGAEVIIIQETEYPWDGVVCIEVAPEVPVSFTLSVRIPGWCRRPALKLNGKEVSLKSVMKKGYARLRRRWREGDRLKLMLPMPIERMEAHPEVRMDCAQVALQRGPIVYCVEESDLGRNLADIRLPHDGKLSLKPGPASLAGVPVIVGDALRRNVKAGEDFLYRPAASRARTVPFLAVPYCLWGNRKPGEMRVWLHEG